MTENKVADVEGTSLWTSGEGLEIRQSISREAAVILAGLYKHDRLIVSLGLFTGDATFLLACLTDKAPVIFIYEMEPGSGSWTIGAPIGMEVLDGYDDLVSCVTEALDVAARDLEVFVLNKQWEKS